MPWKPRSIHGRQARFGFLGSEGPPSFLRLAGPGISIALWFGLSSAGIFNDLILPPPAHVYSAAQDIGWVLLKHLAFTSGRIVIGFLVGCILGFTWGLAMQFKRGVYLVFDGILQTSRPVPPVALVPFFILAFGFSEFGKILLVVLAVAVIVALTTVEAIERVSRPVLWWGIVSGLSRFQTFRRVLVPASWPEMRAGLRIALAAAITIVIVSEYMGAQFGLGYLLSVAKTTLNTSGVFLLIFLIGWLGWFLDRLLVVLFDKTAGWDRRAKGALL
jgi:ABC-type nitrate/sulfonate/bicarbonate transport system permease component